MLLTDDRLDSAMDAASADGFLCKDFTVLREIGQGSYGTVYAAACNIDTETIKRSELVVLKCVKSFTTTEHRARTTLNELSVLRFFSDTLMLLFNKNRRLRHENIVRLHAAVLSPNAKDVAMVLDFMTADLNFVVTCEKQELPPDLAQHLTRQLLSGVAYIHACGLVHGDIKPANILLDDAWTLKLCDFGMVGHGSGETIAPTKLPSLWYRAPELLAGPRPRRTSAGLIA
jgi:serine/threonine protein kinase